MTRGLASLASVLAFAGMATIGCGGASASIGAASPAQGSASGGAEGSTAPAARAANAVLQKDASAVVGGATVAFDGEAEGLAWPALAKVVKSAEGATVVLDAARDVPIEVVLRAAWTLRDADVIVQTPDASGAVRAVELAPKPKGAAAPGTCHLAVFVGADGSLRIAAPGGPRMVGGAKPIESFSRALADERTRCPIRYVAYGAEKTGAAWGSVFDVAWTVKRDGSAGDARVVLAEPVHAGR
jgi:hypothetical protein